MTRRQRGWRWLALIGGGATLFQVITTGYFPYNGVLGGGNSGCARFASNGLASGIDFCYILDCDNGFFGGAFNPCGTDALTALLSDCGTVTGTTGTGAATGTGNNQTGQNNTQNTSN